MARGVIDDVRKYSTGCIAIRMNGKCNIDAIRHI